MDFVMIQREYVRVLRRKYGAMQALLIRRTPERECVARAWATGRGLLYNEQTGVYYERFETNCKRPVGKTYRSDRLGWVTVPDAEVAK